MIEDLNKIVKNDLKRVNDAINMLFSSLESLDAYDTGKWYTPKEREPYDALSDRFIRAIEICIKFFRSYEQLQYADSSETTRDLLNRMEKLRLISSTIKWIEMRELRNRIVHDYLPEQIKEMYDLIMIDFKQELQFVKEKISKLNI